MRWAASPGVHRRYDGGPSRSVRQAPTGHPWRVGRAQIPPLCRGSSRESCARAENPHRISPGAEATWGAVIAGRRMARWWPARSKHGCRLRPSSPVTRSLHTPLFRRPALRVQAPIDTRPPWPGGPGPEGRSAARRGEAVPALAASCDCSPLVHLSALKSRQRQGRVRMAQVNRRVAAVAMTLAVTGIAVLLVQIACPDPPARPPAPIRIGAITLEPPEHSLDCGIEVPAHKGLNVVVEGEKQVAFEALAPLPAGFNGALDVPCCHLHRCVLSDGLDDEVRQAAEVICSAWRGHAQNVRRVAPELSLDGLELLHQPHEDDALAGVHHLDVV
jgi:hypothetical protein